jgi:hypothetical protein
VFSIGNPLNDSTIQPGRVLVKEKLALGFLGKILIPLLKNILLVKGHLLLQK